MSKVNLQGAGDIVAASRTACILFSLPEQKLDKFVNIRTKQRQTSRKAVRRTHQAGHPLQEG